MKPVARAYQLDGATWHYVCARFPTDKIAAGVYAHVMRRTPRGELGIYRHGEPDAGGVNITAISLNRSEVQRLVGPLAAGAGLDEELPAPLVEAMIIRRARVVVEAAHAGAPGGRLKIRHAGAGARLEPDGTMREPGGGVG